MDDRPTKHLMCEVWVVRRLSGDDDIVSNDLAKEYQPYTNVRYATHFMCEAWVAWWLSRDDYAASSHCRTENGFRCASTDCNYNETIDPYSCHYYGKHDDDTKLKDTKKHKNIFFMVFTHTMI